MAEQLEARDAQLDDALSRANVDVSRLSKEAAAQRARAKDIIGRKDAELASINDETSRIVAAHQDLMDAVAQKMTDLGVPTAELGLCTLYKLLPCRPRSSSNPECLSQRRQTVAQDHCQYTASSRCPRARRFVCTSRDAAGV